MSDNELHPCPPPVSSDARKCPPPVSSDVRKYIVADLFCGAGGSSTGALQAVEEIGGRMELVAINHWNVAIATHQANHPTARHLVEDVSIVDPESVVEEGRLDLLMASPECTFHSRARGGKPIHDQGRMAPWAIMNWLTRLDVNAVLVENVPEFVHWGELNENGRPIKAKRGEYFQAWYMAFINLGYQAQWRMLNAADYGDATTRTRFFLIARKDGVPIRWPEPTHAKRDGTLMPGRLPWRGAKEIIDWSNPGRSILDDPKYRRKPLAQNTLRRIARGLERFGGPLAPLYIRLLDIPGAEDLDLKQHPAQDSEIRAFILNRHGENGSQRTHSTDDPTPTVTTRGAGYLVQPAKSRFVAANRNNCVPKSVDDPIPTATTAPGGGIFLAEADAQPFILGQQTCAAPRDNDEPLPTISTRGAISLVEPTIILYYGNSTAQAIDTPLTSITSKGRKHGLIRPALVEYYGNSDATDIEEPLPTVTTKSRHALANPTMLQVNHGNGPQGDRGNDRRVQSVDAPVPSITTKHGLAIAEPVLVRTSQTGRDGHHAHSVHDPLPTITTKNDLVVATPTIAPHDPTPDDPAPKPYIVPNFGERPDQQPRIHDIDQPLPTVTSHGAGGLVVPLIYQVILQQLKDTGIDPRRLVFIDGAPYLLDIMFRMLKNPELARAMGFDSDDNQYEFVGNIAEITKQIGNAVPVHMAAALVKATLGDASE